MKGAVLFFWEIIKILILAALVVIPIRIFLFQPFVVKGASMVPSFENNDYLIIDEITYRFRDPQRGEVIVFRYPFNPSARFIKRVIGLPGEKVEIKEGKVFINGEVLDESSYLKNSFTPGNLICYLKEDEYFVIGDNRRESFDSREWGPLKRKYIIGRAILRAFPLSEVSLIESPKYNLNF